MAEYLVFDSDLNVLEVDIDEDSGEAVLLVVETVDAVKLVDHNLVVASVDRQSTFTVVGYALDRQLWDRLGGVPVDAEELYRRVEHLAGSWSYQVIDN